MSFFHVHPLCSRPICPQVMLLASFYPMLFSSLIISYTSYMRLNGSPWMRRGSWLKIESENERKKKEFSYNHRRFRCSTKAWKKMRNEIKINGWKRFLWFYDDSSINYCYSNCEILVYILGLPTVQCCIVHIIIIIIQITRLDRIITCWCMENLAKIVWSTWRMIRFWVCKVNGSIYWVFYINHSNFIN